MELQVEIKNTHFPIIHTLFCIKVRPYLEMSSNDHRAAAVQLYGRLSKFADESFKTQYLDLCQSVIGKDYWSLRR